MNKRIETLKKLKLYDFQFGRTIGKGGFAKVKVGQNKKTQKSVAIKIMMKQKMINSQCIDHIYNQTYIHSQISHPFIVNFEGIAQDSKYLYMILQLVNGGELFSYLRSKKAFLTEQARFYAGMVVCVFEYLHSLKIAYRDLKPENLLIMKDGYIKFVDFGFAKILTEGRTFTICGTPEYIAPEIILNSGHGKAVDWWTLGIFIYQMIVGVDPFNDDDPMIIYKKILKGKINFTDISDTDAKSLIKHLLVADLSKRYGNLKDGVKDIKEHRWFKSSRFNWQDLLKKRIQPFYIPMLKNNSDVSNFDQYPDSNILAQDVKPMIDPFTSW